MFVIVCFAMFHELCCKHKTANFMFNYLIFFIELDIIRIWSPV